MEPPSPTAAALQARARALIAAMSERARWIYAVPRSPRALLEAEGLRCEQDDAAAGVCRLVAAKGRAAFVVFDNAALGVTLVEAEGEDAPPILARVLEATGFCAQSQLLQAALALREPEASRALRILAHMVVAWDEDWSDLFLLHLASPDPVARHEAALSLTLAAMVARDAGPARALLGEALRRERFPKLRETLEEALWVVEAATGGAVAAPPEDQGRGA
jgi:hypothetical protein